MTSAHPFSLAGQVVFITGASKGIGRATAIMMAAAGATVVVSSRKIEACEAVVKEIEGAGGKAIAVTCNVSSKEHVEEAIKETEKRLGPVTTLVCNAAQNPAYGPMAELEDRAFDKIMQSNVAGNIRLINLVAPGMKAARAGSIIIFSSIAGVMGSKTIGAYALSKAADIQLARNYAIELGPFNIRVNALVPGLIKTDFSTLLWEGERGKAFVRRTPLGRLGDPDEMAGVALFLASKASTYVTGQAIVADGGVTISDPFEY